MGTGSFEYTNGRDIFSKEFPAEDEAETYAQVRKILKQTGCGLVQGSIMLGTQVLRDIEIVFEPHLTLKERSLAAEQNMRGALREYCFDDVR